MANTKISELTDGVTANATDKIPAERSGANVYVTPGYMRTLMGLADDGSNVIAQRNGTSAQAFRVYNTYTDASNYERGFIRYNSNVLEIGHEAAGTGSQRLCRFTSARDGADTAWEFRSSVSMSPRLVFAGTDRSVTLNPDFPSLLNAGGGFMSSRNYSAGAGSFMAFVATNGNGSMRYFGLVGPDAGVMQLNNGTGAGSGYGASLEMWEMTAPSAPATNGVRIYAEDNGSGKTRLMAIFGSGAAQQIAIEP
jgi:hypothetical protein